jgi:lipoate-protein ligase A
LLRHDDRSWAVVGTHEPLEHKYISITSQQENRSTMSHDPSCIIVMGIGGKPEKLLNLQKVAEDGIMVIKRFSGGGTVVLDHNSLWTTWIGRTQHFPHVEPYPRSIMDWSAKTAFGPAFAQLKDQALRIPTQGRKTMVVECKSCGTDSSGTISLEPKDPPPRDCIPDFALRENDYVLGERKMGGNAQSIVKDGWLHHTSFLWDYYPENMAYLSLPSKRPEYRGDRDHTDFLVKLKDVYPGLQPKDLFTALRNAAEQEFDVNVVTLKEAMTLVDDQFGSLQNWFDTKCRTRIVELS